MGITKKAECGSTGPSGPYAEMLHHQYALRNIFKDSHSFFLWVVGSFFVLFCWFFFFFFFFFLSLEAIPRHFLMSGNKPTGVGTSCNQEPPLHTGAGHRFPALLHNP